jgi:anhydro-N-acetylmuramic acid kinase
MATRRYFIGLHSGASLFGVDAALVRVDGVGAAMKMGIEHFVSIPFSSDLRELLWRATTSAAPEVRHLGAAHRILGETYALAVKQLVEQSRQPLKDVMAMGCSGVLLWHDGAGRFPAALELGMTAVLAERTGVTTLSDFKSRDLALGGQGGPLTALVDARLFQDAQEPRVRLDLGTVATVVYLPPQLEVPQRLLGWEATPCTMLLDGLMRIMTNGRESFDAGGKHAVQGRCLEPLLERWLQNHFFQARPPKCVPRHEFGVDFLHRSIEQAKRVGGNLHDVLCTMTHFIAGAIVQSLERHLPRPPQRLLLSGRGVRNGFLWHLLEQKLHGIPLERTDIHDVASDQYKAFANAALAALTIDGVPANLPSVTGASAARVLGQWTPGSPANWARCAAWMARQSASAQAAAA